MQVETPQTSHERGEGLAVFAKTKRGVFLSLSTQTKTNSPSVHRVGRCRAVDLARVGREVLSCLRRRIGLRARVVEVLGLGGGGDN